MKKTLLNKIKVIAIVGPTASGKTDYSIQLAQKLNGEIISADSRLVYKGFDIGTAKPTLNEMQGIPHYMIDIEDPTNEFSAGLYKEKASIIIEKIASKGKLPIVVGGTGLYTDILLKGYQLPGIDADKDYRNYLEEFNNNELYSMLCEKDSYSADKIEKNDRKKIIRALEIIKSSGKPLNQTRSISNQLNYEIEWIGKNFPREKLYERINNRVDIMINKGLIDETKALLDKYGKIYNLVNTIGYREIIRYLDGELTLDESVELLKKNTRNFAKRQLTWFRRNQDIRWDIYPEKLKK